MAVPVSAKAEHRVTRELIAAGADGPMTAQPLDGLSFARGRALHRLVRAGVVREAQGGRYWLDGAAYERWRAARVQRVMWVLVMMGVLFVVLIVLRMMGR